ncbi:MAG TPA: GntR family transcriptional regulator [Humibacter sp.]|nr:GntR family transcriptional regulator [Humibacter sp.]
MAQGGPLGDVLLCDTAQARGMLAIMLTIDPALPVPLYEQLRDQFIAQITTGELAPGDKLPSVRQLAAELDLAPNTVARVYKELEASGYLHTKGRNGTTVAEDLAGNETHRRAAALTNEYLGAMSSLGFNTERTIAYLQRNVGR